MQNDEAIEQSKVDSEKEVLDCVEDIPGSTNLFIVILETLADGQVYHYYEEAKLQEPEHNLAQDQLYPCENAVGGALDIWGHDVLEFYVCLPEHALEKDELDHCYRVKHRADDVDLLTLDAHPVEIVLELCWVTDQGIICIGS